MTFSKKTLGIGGVAAMAAWALIVLAGVAPLQAQDAAARRADLRLATRPPVFIEPGPVVPSTLYADGQELDVQTESVWRYMCGSDLQGADREQWIAELEGIARRAGAFEPEFVVDFAPRTGLNLVFNLGGSVPSAAIPSFAAAEAYLEAQFSDPITVTVNVGFASMGSGVLGATGSDYASSVSWTNSRAGLIAGKDSDDTIQSWLPTGSTIPVRYNGNSSGVTNEDRVYWTIANYRATIGSISGDAADMTYSTDFPWDYDPSNGVDGDKISLVDVIVHETGHALGFTSAADFRNSDIEALDIYRFERTDETGTENPTTLAQFQTFARLVDYDTPNDDHISDLTDIGVEYRMSDGNVYQASHFRQQGAAIGIMDPAFSYGETFYPNYMRTSDQNMFDAIGWDIVRCISPAISAEPEPENLCAGSTAMFTVVADAGGQPMNYQWRKGTTHLVDDGVKIFGAQTATLTIVGVVAGDAAINYKVDIMNPTGGFCSVTSANAALTVSTSGPTITQQPASQDATVGDDVQFTVATSAAAPSYQWRKGGANLSDGGNISGATTDTLLINDVQEADAGDYDVIVTDAGVACESVSNAATLGVTPGGNECAEDLDSNGIVDAQDLAMLLASFLVDAGGDIDGNGSTDSQDLALLLAKFSTSCP